MSLLFDTGKSAELSPCGRYRYTLRRAGLGGSIETINFIMLNPSTADAEIDDPTIRRCIRFTSDWGYNELVVTNLFALRSTDPKALATAADPIGPDNDRHIAQQAAAAALVVCAWGAHGALRGRAAHVVRLLASAGIQPMCLSMTAGGQPGHPLYLPASSLLKSMEGPPC